MTDTSITLSTPPDLTPLLTTPVAVFGGGVSGRGVLALLAKLGVSAVLYDERENLAAGTTPGEGEAPDVRGEFTRRDAAAHQLVVFSPGFAVEHRWLDEARAGGCTCLGELDFAARFWRGRLVAITGTNGKTTLTEFLTHALTLAGEHAIATGNIGRSLAAVAAELEGGTPEHIAVCEVSSFQAETLQHLRADSVLWTNFAEDHLERHAGLDRYFAAKWRLVQRLAPEGVFVLGPSVSAATREYGHALPAGAIELPPAAGAADQSDPSDLPPSAASTSATAIAPEGTVFASPVQRENYALAAAWWRRTGRSDAVLRAAARSFRLGAHRLARVAEGQGVSYWNDSKATNFHAVEAALATFDQPVLLIAGGKAKGGDLAGFVRRIAPRVRHIALIGETAPVLATFCRAYHVHHTRCTSLTDAVALLTHLAQPGDHVLLSPGFASFDMFRGYDDRGRQFEALARAATSSAPVLR